MFNIKGSKGGGKGGQGNARKPDIQRDSVASISTVKMLYGMSEGEIEGLVDGAKSIYLEGTPLIDANGSPNFDDVSYEFLTGTNDQTYIKGFPDVSNESAVGVELKQGTPWVKAINDTQLSAVRVRLKFGRLSETNSDNGDVTGTTVKYAIDLQTDNGVYQTVVDGVVSDKASAGYQRTHRIDLPDATKGWQIRVRRITPNSDSDLIQNDMFVDGIAEVIDAKMRYPNTAMLGLQYNAETFKNIAKVSVLMRGLRIKVPSNYNPQTREYNGLWDGTFKIAYSNNPAWVYYDLLTQWRYGLGERLDASMIDKWSLYTLGQYCDELVSDGKGDQEPRFTCNVYLQKQADAFTVLSNIAGIFRAMSYWNGERIVLDADVPQDPVYTFSRANVVDGTFEYTGTRQRDRHTVAKVAWDNPDNDYQTEYEFVRDEQAMAKYGVKVLDLSAFGCTSQAQAQRAGLWALKTEQLETRQVAFSVGLDGFIPQVGNVIEVSDELFAGRANGGRVSKVSGRNITLDRPLDAGDVLIINGSNGKSERRDIESINGSVVTVVAPFDNAEREHVWAVDSNDLRLIRFRVMSITQNDDMTFNISAVQHEPQKYDSVDFNTNVAPTPISIVSPEIVGAPETITLSSRHRIVQAQTVTTLIIEWSQVSDAVAYDVEWRKDDGQWIRVPRTGNISIEIDGVYSGNYIARVRAISAFDVQSQAQSSMPTAIKGKNGKPPKLAMLKAEGVLFGMDLSWSFAKNSGDADFVEIEQASAPDTNVIKLGEFSYPTNKHTINGLQGGLTIYYRARLVDKFGFKSDWTNWTAGTTDANAEKVLDLVSGQIAESHLNKALSQKIGKIGSLDGAVNAINKKLPSINSQIETEQKRIKEAIEQIGVLQKQSSSQQQKISSITTQQDKLSSSIEQINSSISSNNQALTQQINNIKAQAQKNKSQINDVNQALSSERESRTTAINEMSTMFNNLEIGGRNLILDSAHIYPTGTDHGAYGSFNDTEVLDDGTVVTHADNDGNWYTYVRNSEPIIKGETYTVSVSIKTTHSTEWYVRPSQRMYLSAESTNDEWKRVSLTFVASTDRDANTSWLLGLANNQAGVPVSYKGWKLEKGNKATDWTPAPEDVAEEINNKESKVNVKQLTEALTNADSALATRINSLDTEYKQATSSLKGSIDTLQTTKASKTEVVSLARMGLQSEWKSAANTAKQQAINTAKADAQAKADAAKAAAQQYANAQVNAKSISDKAYADGLISAEEQRAINDANAKLASAKADAQSKANAAESAAKAHAELKIDAIEIGGRNLILNSAKVYPTGSDRGAYGSFDDTEILDDGTVVTHADNDGNWYAYVRSSETIISGETYTVSVSIKTTHQTTWYVRPSQRMYLSAESTNDEWKRVSLTFVASTDRDANTPWLLGLANNQAGVPVSYKGWKLEKGNKATDWTPAPEDIAEEINSTKANLDEFKQTQASNNSAITQQITKLESNLGTKANSTTVNQISNKVQQVDGKVSATANKTTTLQTSVDKNTASVRTQQQSINGLSAQSVLTLDVNGYVTGVGSYNDGKKGSFAVRADEFWIGAPDGSKKKGFVYYATPQTINGVTVPKGLYLDSAFIANGSINMLHIADSIQSDNFVQRKSGWRLYKNGELEINGTASDGSRVLLDNKGLKGFYADGSKAFELGILL